MRALIASVLVSIAATASAADLHREVAERLGSELPSLGTFYRDIHQHPELSLMEARTATAAAREFRSAGFEVTEGVGGTGVVGVLRNGPGPVILIRSELDALPIREETGLPFASTVVVKDLAGRDSPVDHACGHDVHLTALVGAARILSGLRARWSGTLVLVGQPAEETAAGAYAMLRDGLYTRFPRPNFAIALHIHGDSPAGTVSVLEGGACANSDSVDILVRGVGGHGARPDMAKDPVVLASQIVVALQTIVSRETKPGVAAVVTVGTFHGGTKRNVIPEQVKLELTVRSYDSAVAAHLLDSIRRISENLGRAAGMPENLLPVVTVTPEHTPVTYNDPALARRLRGVLADWLGTDRIIPGDPTTAGEDFAWFGRTTPPVPCCMWFVGAADPAKCAESARTGVPLPSNHSPYFAPDFDPTIRACVTSLCAGALDLLSSR